MISIIQITMLQLAPEKFTSRNSPRFHTLSGKTVQKLLEKY